jgi:hypothetical protein
VWQAVHAHFTSLGAATAAAAYPGSLEDYVPNSTHHAHFNLLYVAAAAAAAAAGTLEDCVMEYGKLRMLISMPLLLLLLLLLLQARLRTV